MPGIDAQVTLHRLLLGPLGPEWVDDTSVWLQGIGAEFGLAPDDRYRLELCAEELATNVVKHGGAPCTGLRVWWHACIDTERIGLTQTDPCPAFDPLSVVPPPAAGSLDELRVGGQGIHLMRSFSDACSYTRCNGSNQVELSFKLTRPLDLAVAAARQARGAERRCLAPPSPPASAVPPTTQDRRVCAERRRLGFVSSMKIFQGVPYAALETALAPLTVQDVAGEMVLLKPGDANHSVLLVLRGGLRVYLDQPGEGEFIEAGVGDCVGEMSVIDDHPVSAYVVASKGTRLLVIDGDTFLHKLMAIPRVSRNLISEMSERMRRSDRITVRRMRKLMEVEQAQRELQYARTIQESLLPREPLFADDARLDCVGRMRTAREVGGDFYDIFFIDARHLFFVMADVCGKGLPAALFMVRAIAVLRAQSGHQGLTGGYIENLVANLNHDLCAYNAANQFLTAFCGVLDLETGTVRYVNAGHNPPAMANASGGFRYVGEPVNPPVGMSPGLSFRAGETAFGPDDTLFLYTDGVTEAEDGLGGMLSEERLLACLGAAKGATAVQLVDAVFEDIGQFAGAAEQSDDITVLAIRRLAG